MTASQKISLTDLKKWLNAIRTLEGILRIRLHNKTCHVAIDYWVLHRYAFPSHRDILSQKDRIRDKLYQNYVRCDWLLNWLPKEWNQPVILLPPYKAELNSQLNQQIDAKAFVTLDEKSVKQATRKFIDELDQKSSNDIDAKTMSSLYERSKILFLAVTLGTRQSFKKVRDLIERPDDSSPNLLIDPVSGTPKNMWTDVEQHQAEIEEDACSFWEPILSKQPAREWKHASNRRDALALQSVRFINSRWNPRGESLILISDAPSLLKTAFDVPTDSSETAVKLSDETTLLCFPFVVSPVFFSFYLSHALSDEGTLDRNSKVLSKLEKSRNGLATILNWMEETDLAATDQDRNVLSILNEALDNPSCDDLTGKTLLKHREFLESFLDMNRATVLYSSGIGDQVPALFRRKFDSAVNQLRHARTAILDRYILLSKAAKQADLKSLVTTILEAIDKHSRELHTLSGLCSFMEMEPRSLNYGFLYTGTAVEDLAKTIFGVLQRGFALDRSSEDLRSALLKVRAMAREVNGNAIATLLLAHIKTKLHDLTQDEAAIEELEKGRDSLEGDERKLEASFDFVTNIAEYHLGRLDDAISRAERLTKEPDEKTPRFHLQAGFLHWCRYRADPQASFADLNDAIDFALKAEVLSKNDPETQALARANLARAYGEKARLAIEEESDQSSFWEKAETKIETAVLQCISSFGHAENWPACIVFATAFVRYESMKRHCDAFSASRDEARKAYDILNAKVFSLLPVLDSNKKWRSARDALDYEDLMKKISLCRRELEKKIQDHPLDPNYQGQTADYGPDSTIESQKDGTP